MLQKIGFYITRNSAFSLFSSNSRTENRKERPNRSTNCKYMAKTANSYNVSEGVSIPS